MHLKNPFPAFLAYAILKVKEKYTTFEGCV